MRRLTFVVRAQTDLSALTSGVRTAVVKTAPAVPLESIQALDEALRIAASSDYMLRLVNNQPTREPL